MISGSGMRAVLPMSPYAVALSVVVALCLILFLDALHPPALANAGFAYSAHATVSELLQLTAATVAVLAICAVCLSRCERKRVVSGKSVSVRVDLGGRRIIKKKNT